MRNLRVADRSLKIVIGLRFSAARFQHVRQRRQPIGQPVFCCLSHGPRIRQIGFRGLLQSFIVQQPVVRAHHLKDDAAVGVIKLKIGRQQIVPADRDLLRALQVEDGVIENEERR